MDNVTGSSALKTHQSRRPALFSHFLFLILVLGTVFLPNSVKVSSSIPFLILIVLIEAAVLISRKSRSAQDIAVILYLLLIFWEAGTAKFSTAKIYLLPPPQDVFQIFISDSRLILQGIVSSIQLLLIGFAFSIVLGVGLGIIVGWNVHMREILLPIAKVLTPIPPLIYTPYAIVLLPSFRSASVFIIFCAVFWGLFLSMVHTVAGMNQKLLDSAKTLNIGPTTMFFQILLPYCLPTIKTRLSFSLSAAFMVLISAEMIGGQVGVGWYVKYSTDFGDYTKVIAGIFLVAFLVTVINWGIKRLTRILIPWQEK
ncbi:MAG TPA: ABC transporter permease subunit [Caproicibacter sp.]|nr:ABC transporter permease subunit [Caproicibacter sp.]